MARGLAAAFLACLCLAALPNGASAAPPTGFTETTPITGLTNPTVVRFAPDGRIFVAEKSGLVKVYDNLSDTTATIFADLRLKVYNAWDRGMLGMSLNPEWGSDPSVYVLYAHDAEIGGTAPKYGVPPYTSEGCPDFTGDGCVISGRLSKLTPSGGSSTEQVLIEDWCQQYPSHSVGTLEHDSTGALWASGGDGASFTFVDSGQDGTPVNPCNDPSTTSGGALRSQDLRTPAPADPTSLDGTVIRINDDTGAGLPTNPLAGSSSANERRIVTHGLRNPFRFTISPDDQLYVGDVGWNEWEEISRFTQDSPAITNLGWPCYEGGYTAGNGDSIRQSGYDAANLPICEGLYSAGASAVTPPFYAYHHNTAIGGACPTGTSSIAGLDFYTGSLFSDDYDNALFFADYSRDCIWVMRAGANGQPDPSTITAFDPAANNPVNLQVGPDGALYYPDFDAGTIVRIAPQTGAPTAVATATPSNGPTPLNVQFNGSGSSDPQQPGNTLSYAWDLDNDGAFDDSTAISPTQTYNTAGTVPVRLRVTDSTSLQDITTVNIQPGNTPPAPTISAPDPETMWRVGQQIGLAGSASDTQQGTLPATALDWTLFLNHCPAGCHQHTIQSWEGRSSASFPAPDHEYPSSLTLRLTATDANGLVGTTSMELNPRTIDVTLKSNRPNTQLAFNGATKQAPFTTTVIRGSTNTVSAPSPQFPPGFRLDFLNWSDGGAQTHNITNPKAVYTARFSRTAFP